MERDQSSRDERAEQGGGEGRSRGDDDGIVSEEWLLSLLRELASLLDAPTSASQDKVAGETARVGMEIEDTPLQRCLCAVWDVTCVPEMRALLLEHGAVELLTACVARHSGPQGDRTSEIVAGILGNLASGLEAARTLASNQPALVLCFLLLHASDAPTLVELGRLFQGLMAHAHGDESVRTGLMPHITREAFYDRVQQLVCLDETQVCCAWMPVLVHMMYLGAWLPSTVMKLVLSALSCEVVRVSRRAAAETWVDDDADAGGHGNGGGSGDTDRRSTADSARQRAATADTPGTQQAYALERTSLASSCIDTLVQVVQHAQEDAMEEGETDTDAPSAQFGNGGRLGTSAQEEGGVRESTSQGEEEAEVAGSDAEDQESGDTSMENNNARAHGDHEDARRKEPWQQLRRVRGLLMVCLELRGGGGPCRACKAKTATSARLNHAWLLSCFRQEMCR